MDARSELGNNMLVSQCIGSNANFKNKKNKETREPKTEIKTTGNELKQVVGTINKTNCAD